MYGAYILYVGGVSPINVFWTGTKCFCLFSFLAPTDCQPILLQQRCSSCHLLLSSMLTALLNFLPIGLYSSRGPPALDFQSSSFLCCPNSLRKSYLVGKFFQRVTGKLWISLSLSVFPSSYNVTTFRLGLQRYTFEWRVFNHAFQSIPDLLRHSSQRTAIPLLFFIFCLPLSSLVVYK